jgi:sugar/nucleoside kinase (ribokinase family)
MERRGIVLAGTVILDIVHMIDHWPAEETVALVSHTEHGAGGPPHNAAAGLVKLQAPFPVTCLGAVGDDLLGDQLIASAASYGLDVSGIKRVAAAVTSHTQVMTSMASARRTFFHQVGVNAIMTADMLRPATDDAKIYYVGSPGITKAMDASDQWRGLLREAKARGFVTALEMVPIARELQQKHVLPCLPLVDVLVINDGEAEDLTGLSVVDGEKLDWAKAEACCRQLLEMGVGRLAVVHHPLGAVGVTRGGEVARSGSVNVPRAEIAGTVGAGDAFYAGVLLGFHEGWPLQRCLDLGSASAATSLHSPTTSASIRPWTECFSYALACGVKDTET